MLGYKTILGGKNMSNKNQRNKQKRMLVEMEKEIKTLESNIGNIDLANKKIIAIRNLKISARALQAIAPYVLTAGIVAGGFKLFLGDIPFYPYDESKSYLNTMKEFDSNGNIRTQQQYGNFEGDHYNVLYYYSAWEKGDDELYSRTIKSYRIGSKTYEELVKIIDQENPKIEDVIGNPVSEIIETKNHLTEEELQEESFMKVVLYDEDKNDYIIIKQTVGENFCLSLLYLLIVGIGEVISLAWRDSSSFDFKACVEEIKRKHQLLEKDILIKKLEIKKENYNRLKR